MVFVDNISQHRFPQGDLVLEIFNDKIGILFYG